MRDEILAAVALAVVNSEPSPQNETDTCNRVIYPLLLGAGYKYVEIKAQDLDAAKQKPDYTILPDESDCTWFLEAKGWNVPLDDNHAVQSINYANTQGKRWVVLTNGREWRLYDNHTIGVAHVKLACVAQLKDSTFPTFLEALSSSSIRQHRLEGYVQHQRLYAILGSQLAQEESAVVKAIVKALRTYPGLGSVKSKDVTTFFNDRSSVLTDIPAIASKPKVVHQESTPAAKESHMMSLGSITAEQITGTKPIKVVVPDGSTILVGSWSKFTPTLVTEIAKLHDLPERPFYGSKTSKCPYLASKDSEAFKRMRQPIELSGEWTGIYVETHQSAQLHQTAAVRLCKALGIDPGVFTIELQRTG